MRFAWPPPLGPSATIGVVAPSGPVEADRLDAGAGYLRERGYTVRLAPNLDSRTGFTAGSIEDRLRPLLDFHFDPAIDAVILARGGAGAIDLIDGLPWVDIAAQPKIWMGFSDFTVLASAALRAGMVTFHGPMAASDFWHRRHAVSLDDWESALARRDFPRRWPLAEVWREGSGTGFAVGGCLAPLTALLGTPYEPPLDGGILFWEDVDEAPYRLSRLLTTWKLAGKLKYLRGIVIGALVRCNGAGGRDPAELRGTILAAIGDVDIPIVAAMPFGHDGPNRTFAIGGPVRLETATGELVFEEHEWQSSR